MPPPISKAVFQQRQLQGLRDALRNASVPNATVDAVIGQQSMMDYFYGYVERVDMTLATPTHPAVTGVFLRGQWEYSVDQVLYLEFPPNDPKYLPVFERAQSHPHLYINMAINLEPPFKMLWVTVGTDYTAHIANAPPFDVREIKKPSLF